MEVSRDRPRQVLRLSQTGYNEKILKTFKHWQLGVRSLPMRPDLHLEAAPPEYSATNQLRHEYQSAVDSLMYAMLGTRPDIAFAVSTVSRYAHDPTPERLKAVQYVFEYLNRTRDFSLVFKGEVKPLAGFSDADWAGDKDSRRSTGGYTFNVGGATLSWSSKRQPTIALSSYEAEYMAETQATKEVIYLRNLQSDLDPETDAKPTIIFCDNQAAINLAKNQQYHARSKHTDIQHKFVNEKVADGLVELRYIHASDQVADGLTKTLPKDR